MVTMDGKTVAKQDNFVCGLLSGLIFLSRNNFIPTKDLFTSSILFDVAQYSLENGMAYSHRVFILRRVLDREFFHDVVEIAPFIPSSDPLPCLSPPAFFILMIQNFESYKNC